jgi:hypothetical protein
VCYRAPSWSTNRCAVVCAMLRCTHAWSCSELQRPSMPGEHSRPEKDSMAPQTLEPWRWPLGGTSGFGGPGWPTESSASPTGHNWLPLLTGASRCDAGPPVQALATFPAAKPGAGPHRDGRTPSAPAATKPPRGGAASRHPGGWRARRTRARSAPGCGPSANRPAHRRRRVARPLCARRGVCSAWGAAAVGAHREGGSRSDPGRAAQKPMASRRGRKYCGPNVRTAPRWAHEAPGGRATP